MDSESNTSPITPPSPAASPSHHPSPQDKGNATPKREGPAQSGPARQQPHPSPAQYYQESPRPADDQASPSSAAPRKKRHRRSFRSVMAAIFDNAFLLLTMAMVAYTIEFVDWLTSDDLLNIDQMCGIHPRDTDRLLGIATAHWMHGDFEHLFSNTLPFFMLGGFVLLGGRKMFWKVSAFVALLGGSLLWIGGGKEDNHVGASLVIFGYLGFLLSRGIFEKSPGWIAISVITMVLYGGMIMGLVPGEEQVSWEGHLFGFIAGILAAKLLVPKNRTIYQEEDGITTIQSG